jgi:hypothetical protein
VANGSSGASWTLGDGFAQAVFGQRGGAIVAVRIVAAPPLQNMRHPGAAAAARTPIVAGAAKAAASIAVAADGAIGEIAQRFVDGNGAGFASGKMRLRKRRTALDGAVGFEAERSLAGRTSAPMDNFSGQRTPIRLVASEIPDAVAWQHPKADVAATVIQFGQAVDDVDDLMRLQQHRVVSTAFPIATVSCTCQYFCSGLGDLVEYLRQLRHRQCVDLGC